MCDGISKWEIQLAPSGQRVPGLGKESGWQKLFEGKIFWTHTKILSPNLLYIAKIL